MHPSTGSVSHFDNALRDLHSSRARWVHVTQPRLRLHILVSIIFGIANLYSQLQAFGFWISITPLHCMRYHFIVTSSSYLYTFLSSQIHGTMWISRGSGVG
ncbi:hypothetical protein PSPO01_06562 [Paraphaeosphaeria sporulosa]